MSGLSRNLTIALFMLFILSFRAALAGDCRPQDSWQFSGKVFCAVRMELWMAGATSPSSDSHHSTHVVKNPDNYPEELTRPLGDAIWLPRSMDKMN